MDACLSQGSLGSRFPECLEEIMLGRIRDNVDEAKRDTAIIRVVLKKLITGVKGLHSLGELFCITFCTSSASHESG